MAGPNNRGPFSLMDAPAVVEYQAFALRVLIAAARHVPIATIAREEGCTRPTVYAVLNKYHKEGADDRLGAEREIMLQQLEEAARAWWGGVAVDPDDPEQRPSKTATEMWLAILKARRNILGADAAQKHIHTVEGEIDHRVYPVLDDMERYMQMAERVADMGYGSGRTSEIEENQGKAAEILDAVIVEEVVDTPE